MELMVHKQHVYCVSGSNRCCKPSLTCSSCVGCCGLLLSYVQNPTPSSITNVSKECFTASTPVRYNHCLQFTALRETVMAEHSWEK
jgi:hypothetical protein